MKNRLTRSGLMVLLNEQVHLQLNQGASMYQWGKTLGLTVMVGLSMVFFGRGALAVESSRHFKVSSLMNLNRAEVEEAHLFHSGYVWVGNAHPETSHHSSVDIFSSQGKKIASQSLNHSARYLYPYGDNRVLVVGINGNESRSYYTLISVNAENQIQTSVHPIAMDALADRFVGEPGKLLFTDPGGFDDGELQGPSRTIFKVNQEAVNFLEARIAGPRNAKLLGNLLFIQQTPRLVDISFFSLLDVETQEVKRVSGQEEVFFGVREILPLKENRWVAFNELAKNRIGFIDVKKSQLVKTLPILAGGPRGLAQLGHCLVVGSEMSKKLTFVDIRVVDEAKVIAEWDISQEGPVREMGGFRSLAVDEKAGRLFIRSAYQCPVGSVCSEAYNSVISVEQTSGETLAQCTR